MKVKSVGIGLAMIIGLAQSQTSAPPSPKFEVASVKFTNNSGPGQREDYHPSRGGRLSITNMPLLRIITHAYGIAPAQMAYPAWLNSWRYDIAAKADGDANEHRLALMLQSLLVERFALRFHHEPKEMAFLALVKDKPGTGNGEGLVESSEESCAPFDQTPGFGSPANLPCGGIYTWLSFRGWNRMHGQNTSLSALAKALSELLGRPVVNETGNTGRVDIEMQWSRDAGEGPIDPDDASVFRAIQEHLGLKFESRKGPVDIFVIDSVEKPSEN